MICMATYINQMFTQSYYTGYNMYIDMYTQMNVYM